MLALRLSRYPKLLNAECLQELCHHLLKAHVYKHLAKEMRSVSARDTQAFWVSFCAQDIENSLATTKNVFCFNSKISRLLLLAGANPDARTPFLENAPLLCVAARMGIVDFVLLLLEFGADVGAVGEDGVSALV